MTNIILKASIFNIGCKVNQVECDYIYAYLTKQGIVCCYDLVEDSDLYIVNTCAVTNEAERKSRQIISRIRAVNSDAPIVVMGCASELNVEFYTRQKVYAVLGARRKTLVLATLEDLIKNDSTLFICEHGRKGLKKDAKTFAVYESFLTPQKSYDEFNISPMTSRSRAYIKIQDGCDNFCSYCIIPYLRGGSRSRTINNIMTEVSEIAQEAKEIVITGINLSSFGKDNNMRLSDLFKELSKVNSRIRIGSFYAEAIDNELLDVLKGMPNFCEHFHLSLQSGSDRILKLMNRRYTANNYIEKVALVRQYFPLASITTDIIIGYPDETDEDFNQTIDLVKNIEFSDLHIFPFSPRPLTKAEGLPQLPQSIIEKRKQVITQVKNQLKCLYSYKMLNYPQNVIFEQTLNDGISYGYSEYYIKVYAKTNALQGRIQPLQVYRDGILGILDK